MKQRLDIGRVCTYKNQECTIDKFVSRDKLILRNISSGNIFLALISDVIIDDSKSDSSQPLELITDDEWSIAQGRFAILNCFYSELEKTESAKHTEIANQVALENNISSRTLFRWKKIFERTGQISDLVPSKSSGGRGQSRLDIEMDRLITQTIKESYFQSQSPKAKKSYLELVKKCRKLEITPPSENTFRSRISYLSKKENLIKRHGRIMTHQMVEPVPGNYPKVNSPLEVVQIDHTPLDVIVVSEDRKPIGRPWLTLGIDLFSRMVTGFYVSLDTPGSLGTGICIANSMLTKEAVVAKYNLKSEWPINGKIQNLHSDNAPEFKSKSLLMACQEYSMNLNYRGKGKVHWGGHIERLLGNFSSELHSIPGTTFSNTRERHNYNSHEHSVLTLSELEEWLTTFIVDVYHQSVHSTIQMSPLLKYYDGIFQFDKELPSGQGSYDFDPFKVKIDFLPSESRTIQRTGVQIDHIRYYGDILKPYLYNTSSAGNLYSPRKRTTEKYIFKRDPRDLSCIFFLDPKQKQYFPVYYANSTRPPISIWEHREILREIKKRGEIDKITEDKIFETYDKLDRIIDKAKHAKKTAIKVERRKKADDFKTGINLKKVESKDSSDDDSKIDFNNIEIFTHSDDL